MDITTCPTKIYPTVAEAPILGISIVVARTWEAPSNPPVYIHQGASIHSFFICIPFPNNDTISKAKAPTINETAEAIVGEPTIALNCALTLNWVGRAIPANIANNTNMIAT